MGVLLFLGYFFGLFVAGTVYLARAGLFSKSLTRGVNYREFLVPNPGWTLLWALKVVFWPAVTTFWAVTLFRRSPWRATVELEGRKVRKIQRISVW